jgi:hypothetical protein
MAHPAATTAIASLLSGILVLTGAAPDPAESSATDSATTTTLRVVSYEGSRPVASEHPFTDEQRNLLDWARDRFGGAGLDFPAVEFVFHDSSRDCYQHVGLYFPAANSLHMCRLDKKTVLHELAHAWAHHSLSEEQRQQFVAFSDAASWNDNDVAWEYRATEYAAEAMTWALMDQDITVRWINEDGSMTRILLTIANSSPRDLAAAYRQLTGLEPVYRNLDDITEPAADERLAGKFGA